MIRKAPELRHAWTLALLGGLLASALGVLLGFEVGGALRARAELDAERAAIDVPRLLFEVVRLTQDHRALSATVLSGQATAEGARRERKVELDQVMSLFGEHLGPTRADDITRADWAQINLQWQGLAQAVQLRRIAVAESAQRHGTLIEAELDVHDRLEELPARRSARATAAVFQRAPRLLQALSSAPGGAVDADTTLARWRQAVAALMQTAPPARVQSLFAEADLALAQWSVTARDTTDATDATDATGGREAVQAIQFALGGAQAWQRVQIARGQERVQRRLLLAGALALLLAGLWLAVTAAALQRVRAERVRRARPAAPAAAPDAALAQSPAALGERLLQALRLRARRPPEPPTAPPGAQATRRAETAVERSDDSLR